MKEKVCSICGIVDENVQPFAKKVEVLGKAAELFDMNKLEDVLVLDLNVEEICPYCAEVEGFKTDPEIKEKVAYYVGLIRGSIPDEDIEPARVERRKPEKDKVEEVLFEVQDALNRLLNVIEGKEED